MAEYWLKTDAQAEAQGPYSGTDLKAYAAAGQIEPDWLVSPNQQKWVKAKRVSGLIFPPATATPGPAVTETADPYSAGPASMDALEDAAAYEPAADLQEPQSLPAPALSYAVPGVYSGGQPGKYRNLNWLVIAAVVVGAIQLAANVYARLNAPAMTTPRTSTMVVPAAGAGAPTRTVRSPAPFQKPSAAFWIVIGLTVLASFAIVGFFIYLLVWIYKVHNEMRTYTGGSYPISPGKALGFCFIPIYGWFWHVHMPGKLADVVRLRLGGGSAVVNPSTVRTLCILGIILGFFLPGAELILFSLAIQKIQNGLNALWGLSGQTA